MLVAALVESHQTLLNSLSAMHTLTTPNWDRRGEIDMKKEYDYLVMKEIAAGNLAESSIDLAFNCFGTICYRYKSCRQNLHKNCLLHQSAVFKNTPEEFVEMATTACPWTKTQFTPAFSGIP